MKHAVNFIGLSLLVSGVAAASDSAQLREKLATIDTLRADFVQQVFDERDILQEELAGELVLKRPHFLRWETQQPDHSVMVADGETVWYYNSFIEQLSIFDQAYNLEQNPMLVLLSDDDEAWSEFLVERDGEAWVIRDPNPSYASVSLAVTFGEDNELQGLRINDGQGQISVFQLSQVVLNETVTKDVFIFTPPAGVEVDDQRITR